MANSSNSPLRDDVLDAVVSCRDQGLEQPNPRLDQWGEDALPVFRALAMEGLERVDEGSLISCIFRAFSSTRWELLLDIAEGKTALDPGVCFATLTVRSTFSEDWAAKERSCPRLKAIAFSFAEAEFKAARDSFARLAARLDWKDAIDAITPMLTDRNQGSRRAAAEALSSLQGVEVPYHREPASFGRTGIIEGLFGNAMGSAIAPGSPFPIRSEGEFRIGHIERKKEKVGNQIERSTHVVFAGTDEMEEVRFCFKERIDKALGLARQDGDDLLVICRAMPHAENSNQLSSRLCALDGMGQEIWHHDLGVPSPFNERRFAPLYTGAGVRGILVTEDDALVSIGLDGEVLWRHKLGGGHGPILTHPQLPGVVYQLDFGSVDRYQVSEEDCVLECSQGDTESRFAIFATEGVLFPDEKGAPSLVLAGMNFDMVPTLIRASEIGETLWTATMPHELYTLTVVGPNRGTHFVVTEFHSRDASDLIVIDKDGTLVNRQRLPGEDTSVFDLTAYESSPGDWSVLVDAGEQSWVLPFHFLE